jgi:hypothetical protein
VNAALSSALHTIVLITSPDLEAQDMSTCYHGTNLGYAQSSARHLTIVQ